MTLYAEDDLLPLSGLQHLAFCERQAALIHVEGLWAENRLTAEGHVMHERVHVPGAEKRKDVRMEYSVPLRSMELGLSGKADVLEWHRFSEPGSTRWAPYPVEYKRGKPKKEAWDAVQVCAQAICLEEMLGVFIREGALYYGQTKRRLSVILDEPLRDCTRDLARRFHGLMEARKIPKADPGTKCHQCSLIEVCMPKTADGIISAKKYLEEALKNG